MDEFKQQVIKDFARCIASGFETVVSLPYGPEFFVIFEFHPDVSKVYFIFFGEVKAVDFVQGLDYIFQEILFVFDIMRISAFFRALCLLIRLGAFRDLVGTCCRHDNRVGYHLWLGAGLFEVV
ncbi:MAG: hypothetical protein PHV51_06125 [Methanosarcinaceae archaeon]|nr:hypothetical protein [Methanosarcinaceae archaeon]MDD4497710.1 hypothetical protein [Methanosarcinaceae archaeon]